MIWTDLTLGDLTKNCDTARRPIRESERVPGSTPYFGASGVIDYVAGQTHEGNYLLVAEDGENLRSRSTPVAFVTEGRFWANNHVHVLMAEDKSETAFLGYLLAATDLSGYLTGSTLPKLTQRALSAIRLRVPDRATRVAIAAVLGALDNKIAANQNLALSADHLATAYSEASPAVCSVADLCDFDRRTVSPSILDSHTVAHYSIPSYDNDRQPSSDHPSMIKSNKFFIDSPRVLISKLNPRFPRIWVVDAVTGLPGLASTELLPVAPTAVSYRVLGAVLGAARFSRQLESQVAGTSGSHQRVRPEDVMRVEVSDPRALPSDVVELIDDLVGLAVQTRSENKTLVELRGTLLPALMSGRLRVKEAEKHVEDAV